ncbi:4-hydroxybenzoate 3-monooxygenase [Salinibacterium sp. dk2585]|uniref:4-hydroxybenzoate 3-monooxygenase n=1 Tax=unclassified Salinibacterium TaxID=2632331 RepID=UPI0011C24FC2|nr:MULTISPECIES: 4-hydroxybenzoate 3-monooxygenase [unclassified Salinibacterium]QEE62155.1 4-hydroxybenzoate 3-monooxygenase [Salinibacterium sp. dk2585]TXK53507.1 4-hydroxybenzoate 3-monooxygenase [Salinibacterium sp. dk5596]
MTETIRTQVGIIGAGPAGLLLSHLLDRAGISSVVIDKRSREDIEKTIRAGILEQGTVDVLVNTGVSDRVLRDGHKHDGIELRFQGEGHRIDFPSLVGRSVYLYPQHEVLIDLIASRLAAGADIRFGASNAALHGQLSDSPSISFTDDSGQDLVVECDFIAGTDGSQGIAKWSIPETDRRDFFRPYPFAWFGILAEASPSSEELIYSAGDNGFALISQRSETVQRMYFQCDPETDTNTWGEEQIWDELQARVPGHELKRGHIFQKDVLQFRSYVCETMQYGRMFLAGDAAHTVPPTGAKGMNLAVADVLVLADAMTAYFDNGSTEKLDNYAPTALKRIWRGQQFSYWMTSMLHATPDEHPFDKQRRYGELETVTSSPAGQTYLAEAYTGWPFDVSYS